MIAMIIEKIFNGNKVENITDKKSWVINTVKNSKFPSMSKVLEAFKLCDTWTRVSIVEETAYIVPNKAIGSLMVYASKNDPEEPVRRKAKFIIGSKVSLQKHVNTAWGESY